MICINFRQGGLNSLSIHADTLPENRHCFHILVKYNVLFNLLKNFLLTGYNSQQGDRGFGHKPTQ
jgi:hypothetical protein